MCVCVYVLSNIYEGECPLGFTVVMRFSLWSEITDETFKSRFRSPFVVSAANSRKDQKAWTNFNRPLCVFAHPSSHNRLFVCVCLVLNALKFIMKWTVSCYKWRSYSFRLGVD